jgi:hypothetical protein
MEDDGPFGWHATLQRIIPTARDAATVTRLLARRPTHCPLMRCAFERVLLQTLEAWSRDDPERVRPAGRARRTLEPVLLQTAHVLQPRKGEAR